MSTEAFIYVLPFIVFIIIAANWHIIERWYDNTIFFIEIVMLLFSDSESDRSF